MALMNARYYLQAGADSVGSPKFRAGHNVFHPELRIETSQDEKLQISRTDVSDDAVLRITRPIQAVKVVANDGDDANAVFLVGVMDFQWAWINFKSSLPTIYGSTSIAGCETSILLHIVCPDCPKPRPLILIFAIQWLRRYPAWRSQIPNLGPERLSPKPHTFIEWTLLLGACDHNSTALLDPCCDTQPNLARLVITT
ncbi:hypothetical protein EV424DRAFT_1354284 [Suillus variegatus]|nr:hypothetical protein EV424DRAFT_1354284 [Suillus variegatus]